VVSVEKPSFRPTNVRWYVLALIAFASSSAYLTRYCISAANTTIQQDVGLDDKQMGLMMSVFSLGYFICQIPGGWLGTRFGTRFAFAFISAVWSLCNVMSAVSFSFLPMLGSRFLLGCFQAGLVPISAKVLRDWIPQPRRGMSSAAIGACMSLGGAFTMWFTGWLLKIDLHWRWIFASYALVGIAWSIVYYQFFRTKPNEHQRVNKSELDLIEEKLEKAEQPSTSNPSEKNILLAMLTSVSMWALCIQSFFRAAGYAFFVTWFFAFLEYVYGVTKAEAGFLNSLPLLAVVIGTSCGGAVVDYLWSLTKSKWLSRSGTAVFSLAMSALFTYLSVWTNNATQLSCMIALGALFSGLGSPAAWCASIDLGGKQTSLVIATMNMAGSVAGMVLPFLLGSWFMEIRKRAAEQIEAGGEQVEQLSGDWIAVIYLHAGFYLIGAVCWLFVRPNRSLAGP